MKRVEWDEPYPGYNEKGKECTVNLHCSMTMKDAIRASRAHFKQVKPEVALPSAKVLLTDFIAIRWAIITEDNRVY